MSEEQTEQTFEIQKIYLKDVSFESPKSPALFQEKWEPVSNLNIGTQHREIGENLYEVVITMTTTVTVNEQTAFLAEIQQAGIFALAGFEEGALGHVLGSYCPNTLFPYAREAISDLTTKGGFPTLVLAPVNFDAIYAQRQQEIQQREESGSDETKH